MRPLQLMLTLVLGPTLACGGGFLEQTPPAPVIAVDGCYSGDGEMPVPPAVPAGLIDGLVAGQPIDEIDRYDLTTAFVGKQQIEVPQLSEQGWRAATQKTGADSGPVGGGLLLCEVEADGGNAPRSGRALPSDIKMTLPDGITIIDFGAAKEPKHTFSVPGVNLSESDRVGLVAVSHNAHCDLGWLLATGLPICWDRQTPIGSAATTWTPGEPMRFAAGAVTGQCTLVGRDEVEALASHTIQQATRAFDTFCGEARIDVWAADLRAGPTSLDEVDEAIAELHALLGYADPRAMALKERREKVSAGLASAARDAVTGLIPSALPIGQPLDLYENGSRVRVMSPMACGKAAESEVFSSLVSEPGMPVCTLRLEVERTGTDSITVQGSGSWLSLGQESEPRVVFGDGTTTELWFAGVAGPGTTALGSDPVSLGPGATATLRGVFHARDDQLAEGQPVLLRVGGSWGWSGFFAIR